MRDSAKPAFITITEEYEGPATINWLFPDVKNLVSTGMGLLLDPVAMAFQLPWRRPDGSLATRDEIIADFNRVKSDPNAARNGHRYAKKIAVLRCDPSDIRAYVLGKVATNEARLKQGFPDFDEYPADAQLAMHSLAWACGPSYFSPKAGRCYFPKLTAAIIARDFATAAVECQMDETGNPGLRPRNKTDKLLFQNAAVVLAELLDPADLYWPRDLSSVGKDPAGPEYHPTPAEGDVTIVDFPITHPDVDLPKNDPFKDD